MFSEELKLGKDKVDLINFQNRNCPGCLFADRYKIGTGKPCCTYLKLIDADNGVCKTRREYKYPEKADQ